MYLYLYMSMYPPVNTRHGVINIYVGHVGYIIYTYIYIYVCDQRKFRSQTSDNMDKWKAEVGRVREEKNKEYQKDKISK